jgi:hypothetical protein
MSVSDSRPFALDFFSQVDGANGMSIGDALSEFVDNAKDAESTFHWTIVTAIHEPSKTYMVISLDHGNGLKKLPQLYGLGDTTVKKSEGKLGLKNTGHMAAVAAFKPDIVHYYTDTEEGPAFMCFRLKEYYDAYKAEMAAGGSRDYRKATLNPTNYMTYNKSRTEDDTDILSRAIDMVKTPEVRAALTNIRSKAACNHLLQIMVFSDDRSASISDHLKDATNQFRFYYPKALQGGFQIGLEQANGHVLRVMGDNSISPLGAGTFPRITYKCKARRTTNDRLLIEVQMTVGDSEKMYTFWMADAGFVTRRPQTWDASKPMGDFDMQISCISQAEQVQQAQDLGYGVRDMRGVYCEFIDRILGLPYWDGHNFGANDNAGGVRAVITFREHAVAEELFAIQSHKHKTNIKSAHPVVKDLIKKIMRHVIDNYSNYTKNTAGRGQNPGVLSWDIDKCYRQLSGIPEPPPPRPSPTPTPPPTDSDSEESPDEDSEEEDSELDDDPEPRPQPQPRLQLSSADQGTNIRLEYGTTVITFPHNGLYLPLRTILYKRFQQLGPQPGLEYLQAFAHLHT